MIDAERASWQNPRVLTTLLLVFITGALAGALSMRLGLHERLHPSGAGLSSPNNSRAFLDKCTKELNLSPDQTRKMQAVLDDYKSYYQNVQDQYEEVRATGKIRILQILDDKQKARFEKLLTEMK